MHHRWLLRMHFRWFVYFLASDKLSACMGNITHVVVVSMLKHSLAKQREKLREYESHAFGGKAVALKNQRTSHCISRETHAFGLIESEAGCVCYTLNITHLPWRNWISTILSVLPTTHVFVSHITSENIRKLCSLVVADTRTKCIHRIIALVSGGISSLVVHITKPSNFRSNKRKWHGIARAAMTMTVRKKQTNKSVEKTHSIRRDRLQGKGHMITMIAQCPLTLND